MATEQQVCPFSVASVVEDILKQHGGTRLSDIDLASRKAEETSSRRYEATGWLRKTAVVVGGKDLPAEPSEEEFRLGLRSGIILCNALNKVQPGAIPKVVEGPCDSVITPDGAALSAYQYFENVRNFLVAAEEVGLPAFEASDLEQGGKSARIVNCVLALKAYGEWKQSGGTRTWKYGGNLKPPTCGKPFARKNSEPFMNSFSRTSSFCSVSSGDQPLCDDIGQEPSEAGACHSLSMLVRAVFSNKRQEEIPYIIESLLNKVTEEFECRLASQNELAKTVANGMTISSADLSCSRSSSDAKEEEAFTQINSKEHFCNEEPKVKPSKQQIMFKKQQRDIQELKHILHSTKEGMQFLRTKYQEEFETLGEHLQDLAHAASGYQKILEDNRKLYNQVQDLRGNIRVYCRVRPFLPGQPNRLTTLDQTDEGEITIINSSKYSKEGWKSFRFNKVFGPLATQEEVFSDTRPLIRSVLDGYNVCIFAYGQTGSGKTYTMTGPKDLTEESLGVNYRSLSDLFLLSNQRKDVISYDISVQMLEIYNEQVRDLLVTDGLNRRLEIRNSSQNGINVPDASIIPVSSTFDVINLMNVGLKNRAVGATAMNDRSSRSHSCLTVHVQGRDLASGTVLRGSMHLVDLAGSERVDKSEATGDRLKEAQHINKSLSALGDVISSLAQNNSHVPYRNSKLTQLLQDSLGGQAKTLMFVHISPELEALGETSSTLKFAERVATVELGAAKVNKDSVEVKELKEQISGLKAALASKAGEMEHWQHSQSSTPDGVQMNCRGISRQLSWYSAGNISNRHRQLMEEVGGLKVTNNPSSIPRRRSLDLHDLQRKSPLWPPVGSPAQNGKKDNKELVSFDWIDKDTVNRHDTISRDENSLGQWEVNGRQLPEMFHQRSIRDPSKMYPEQSYNITTTDTMDGQECDALRSQCEMASTGDSDELGAGTSDSSEPDLLWQSNLARVSSFPKMSEYKTKKTYPRSLRGAETRSLIPSLIPSPSKKLPSGIIPSISRPGRHLVSVDGKRKTGHAT